MSVGFLRRVSADQAVDLTLEPQEIILIHESSTWHWSFANNRWQFITKLKESVVFVVGGIEY